MGFVVRFWRALILVCLLAVTVVPAAQAEEVDSTAKSFWLHMNSTPTTDEMIAAEASRRAYVVLNAWEADLAAKLKAVNPKIQTFVYKDLSSTRSYACSNGVDDADLPTGVGYCEASNNHSEW